MDRTAFTFDTIQKIRQASSPKELMVILAEVGEQFGFAKACAIATIPQPKQNFAEYCYAERWPDGWHERYLARRYLDHDPVIKWLRKAEDPIAWHELGGGRVGDKNATLIMNEASDFTLLKGFNIPIRSIKGELATVVFAGDRFDLAWEDRPVLLLIAIYAHDRIREMMGVRPIHPGQERPLTPREIEVLKWTAEGKTSQDIAEILDVAVPTVQTHIANLCRKLDVVTRAQATARAIRWGILS